MIGASALGLPVSTTHITPGAIFGVGFFREYKNRIHCRTRETGFDSANHQRRGLLAVPVRRICPRKLVRRREFLSILTAWFITVPSSTCWHWPRPRPPS